MPIVNGEQTRPGCYIEGHWGQYGPDRVAEIAEGFGWEPPVVTVDAPTPLNVGSYADDPRGWRKIIESNDLTPDQEAIVWEYHSESADDIETWLNDHTPLVCLNCSQPMEWREGLVRAIHVDSGRMYCYGGPTGACKGQPDGKYGLPMGSPQSYVWNWHDGEFFLSPICENGDCDDDTCAHWD